MADLTQQEWKAKLEADNNALVLDVRTPEEVAQGIIPNAIHIDIFKGQGFIDEVQQLDKTKSYFIYCKAGARSGQACAVMNQLGFNKTYNLLGGFNEWQGEVSSL
ncbi:rhodanese-like domain-containing protein [Psychroserpens mesophilus]|uniref:rhodanese-like domain-containing protein n=1 Tax=Psychroserpens mesophilus TaxID=325473 RepID=UPI00058E37D1|nr:rhodanese-like domain-containing protein [Psychroserpens mesophilus]